MKNATTRSGPAEHVAAVSAEAFKLAGMIRRFAVTLTSGTFWQLLGHLLLDGKPETHESEVFGGVGFYARPPAGSRPEAIAVSLAGGGEPVIIATRDEQTRQAVAGELAEGETATFSDQTISVHKANGTIEHRSAGGTAELLALKADLQALRAAIEGWAPVNGDGGAALQAALLDLFGDGWPAGTTVLKGE